MSPEWVSILLTALGLLGAGTLKLWQALRAARQRELEAARDEAYQKARSEALVREAQATVAQKNAELDTATALIVQKDERIDDLLSVVRRLSGERPA